MATITASDLLHLHLRLAERIQLVADLWDTVADEAGYART